MVDNDGNAHMSNERCRFSNLSQGSHLLYIEGWSESAALSASLTYGGLDTNYTQVSITAAKNPFAPSSNMTILDECNPGSSRSGDSNFTICFFKADKNYNLLKIDDVGFLHSQV